MKKFSLAFLMGAVFGALILPALRAATAKSSGAPNAVRVVPKDGLLLGEGVAIDLAKQLAVKEVIIATTGASISPLVQNPNPQPPREVSSLRMGMHPGPDEHTLSLKPSAGRWDLRQFLQVRVKFRNQGQVSAIPSAWLNSDSGPSETISVAAPIPPGGEGEIVVPFASSRIWNGQPGTGTQFASDAVSTVGISVPPSEAEQQLFLESIVAEVPPYVAPDRPLGVRPPVPGDWVQTFNEDFDGTAINEARWNVHAENWWDPKKTHFAKDDVIVSGGRVALRYEKKTGFQNDDPTKLETPYATGYLNSLGKWGQRYGYFEARMKLPTSPGLWPAFWMMPDRGAGAADRESTGNGGMEFDIMEHLSRWGPYRYNIAMHWGGYEKDHKSVGSEKIYVQPDEDGYITCGLLWTPGELVYYGNGHEVLRWKNERVSKVPSYLIFYLPSGGWDNDEIDDKRLPADFCIDYVRVWQRKDLASSADSLPSLHLKRK